MKYVGAQFAEMLVGVINDQFSERYRNLEPEEYKIATQLIEDVLEKVADNLGLHQIRELWRIDFLWYHSLDGQEYYHAQRTRVYPVETPAVALEHENYESNIGAAFLRVLGVRSENRVVIAWPEDPQGCLQSLVELRDRTRKTGLFPENGEVVVVFMDNESPVAKAQWAVVTSTESPTLVQVQAV